MQKRATLILNWLFPWVAMTGLLLATYGLMSTPDDVREGHEMAAWKITSLSKGK